MYKPVSLSLNQSVTEWPMSEGFIEQFHNRYQSKCVIKRTSKAEQLYGSVTECDRRCGGLCLPMSGLVLVISIFQLAIPFKVTDGLSTC
jgi:hypothetical protein